MSEGTVTLDVHELVRRILRLESRVAELERRQSESLTSTVRSL